MARHIVFTPKAAKPPPAYSQAVKAAGLVFVSGTAPTDPTTGAIQGTTIQEQTRQCLTNIRAILEAAGSSLDKVVSATVVLAEEDDFAGMNEEWLRWFPSDPPARQGAKMPARIAGLKVSIAAIAEASPRAGACALMFDHVKFGVSDYDASKAFFLQALEPLGVAVASEGAPAYGVELVRRDSTASLCLFQTDEKPAPLHLAFAAESRQQVDAFYRAALAAGGKDNGAPGLRPQYHANYYAAFVIGPDGHNVEVVCHEAEA